MASRSPLFVTTEQAAMLRELLAAWPKLRPGLSEIISGSQVTRNETPAQQLPRAVTPNPDGSYWFEIQSASVVATNQWNYKGRVMKSGDTSSLTGLVKTVDTTQYDLRNAFEHISLGGLTGISSLVVIATNSVVRAWPEIRNNVRVFVFERPNDIVCTVARAGEIVAGGVYSTSTNITLDDTMAVVRVTASAGDITLTIPDPSTVGDYDWFVINDSGHNVIFDPTGAITIDGAATVTIADGTNRHIISDGSTLVTG